LILALRRKFSEKRDFMRLLINSEFTFKSPDEKKEHRAFCRNLSHTGIQFTTEHKLSKGGTIHINIDTKDTKFKPFIATVSIVRIESVGDKEYKVAGRITDIK
jgi:hypothetical protein